MNSKKRLCPICSVEFHVFGFYKHLKSHGIDFYLSYKQKENDEKNKTSVYVDGIWKCAECDYKSSKKAGVSNHFWQKHREYKKPNRSGNGLNFGRKGKISWNTGLTKDTDERVKRNGENVSKTFREQIAEGTYVTSSMGPEARKRLSERQSLHNSGGKCKWYDVTGTSVQGRWERDIALKLNEFGVEWEKPTIKDEIWKYDISGSIRSYTPDFYLPEYNCWLEIKGYWWGNDLEKMKLIQEAYPDRILYIIQEQEYKKLLSGEQVWLLRRTENPQK